MATRLGKEGCGRRWVGGRFDGLQGGLRRPGEDGEEEEKMEREGRKEMH